MNNMYEDTEHRMLHDAEFKSLVDHLVLFARVQGYTPGELRQAAFAAAVIVEVRYAKPFVMKVEDSVTRAVNEAHTRSKKNRSKE